MHAACTFVHEPLVVAFFITKFRVPISSDGNQLAVIALAQHHLNERVKSRRAVIYNCDHE